MKSKLSASQVMLHIVMIIISVLLIFPVIWMVTFIFILLISECLRFIRQLFREIRFKLIYPGILCMILFLRLQHEWKVILRIQRLLIYWVTGMKMVVLIIWIVRER